MITFKMEGKVVASIDYTHQLVYSIYRSKLELLKIIADHYNRNLLDREQKYNAIRVSECIGKKHYRIITTEDIPINDVDLPSNHYFG